MIIIVHERCILEFRDTIRVPCYKINCLCDYQGSWSFWVGFLIYDVIEQRGCAKYLEFSFWSKIVCCKVEMKKMFVENNNIQQHKKEVRHKCNWKKSKISVMVLPLPSPLTSLTWSLIQSRNMLEIQYHFRDQHNQKYWEL